MLNFIQTEFIKLKSSRLFLLSNIIVFLIPLLFVGIFLIANIPRPQFSDLFQTVFQSLYSPLSIILFAVIGTYLFVKEYDEHTLKLIFTVPISKKKFLAGKILTFLIWVLILSIVLFISTIIFGFIGGISGLSLEVILTGLETFIGGSILVFLTMTPFIFIGLISKSIVPAAIGSAILFILTGTIGQAFKWAHLIPWMIPSDIISGIADKLYGMEISSLILIATFIIGIVLSWIYLEKTDVQL